MAKTNKPYRLVGLFCLATALPYTALSQPFSAYPTDVWIRGGDIETPEHVLTQRLRDELIDVIGAIPRPRADSEPTVVWLPEDVHIDVDSFTYRASLADKQLRVWRSSAGKCNVHELRDCARAILRELGA